MREIEAFLYRAARLLDGGDVRGWFALCRPEMVYRVTSVLSVERGYDVGLIDDDYRALEGRIRSIEQFWHAEEPRTHLLHVITNVEIVEERTGGLTVASALTLVATRRDRQAVLYGRAQDELRKDDGRLSFERRIVTLENNLLLDGKITFIV